jgi:predicted O-methyltransferase YrrM
MDVSAFLDRAEDLFAGDPYEGALADPAHAELVREVAGMTTARQVAVLNLAARLLPPDECYLEVGTFKGRSICGATRGVEGGCFVAIENFVEFGMSGREARAELEANLSRHCAGKDVRVVEGDAFAVLRSGHAVDRPVGVYFYDGEHTGLSHYLALGVVEPLLADEALVLVDDATWPLVQRAHARFLATHPGWTVVRRWDARVNDDPEWANGLHALRFSRGPRARAPDPRVRFALVVQRGIVGPARRTVWRVLARAPWLVPLAKRLEPKSGHTIGADAGPP